MAGFADGAKTDAERAAFKRIADSLPSDAVDPAALCQRVLLGRLTVPEAVKPLHELAQRQLAYEMAVCVCDADGAQTEAERTFLAGLRRELQLDPEAARSFERQADALAVEPLADPVPVPPPAAGPVGNDADVDRMVLNYAILNGALELLPESLATMAIVPLQMKLVYRIGQRYGHNLDRGHIKELLAAAGVGLTSQVLEGYARKLLGGLLGRAGGGLLKTAGRQAASSAMSFAATWALGKLAQQYYAGGRRFSAIELRALFGALAEQGRGLHSRHAGEIQSRASSLDIKQLLPLIRGSQ